MILNNDFRSAVDVLRQLTASQPVSSDAIVPALKIIHKAVQMGSKEQKSELLEKRREIVALNTLIAKKTLQIEENFQIAVPETAFEKMLHTAYLIPCAIVSILIDILLLPAAGILLLAMLAKPKFDPESPKQNGVPILLLHGSGFNESEWAFGRMFLKNDNYGSVFSLNYDKMASNDPTKGIDDYAAEKVREKIQEIKRLTNQDELIIIGHSMGGLIAGDYADKFSKEDGVKVKHIISLASPWQGSPVVDRFLAGPNDPKRYKHMSTDNPYRKELVENTLRAERNGDLKLYNIGSETDFLVPGFSSFITEDPRRQKMFEYLGHYGIIVSIQAWLQVRTWLDSIYKS
ncbi:MAG: alpha/beta fold hydrolase [Verrucomicrobia bacterium]|nr:alpha/beta fold hydrolase [Verrucomicrobiota bacterium]